MNDGAEFYIDNLLTTEEITPGSDAVTTEGRGRILLGRYHAESSEYKYGQLTVDWLTIWDRPLTEEERNLVHQN